MQCWLVQAQEENTASQRENTQKGEREQHTGQANCPFSPVNWKTLSQGAGMLTQNISLSNRGNEPRGNVLFLFNRCRKQLQKGQSVSK
jgi:hypothetical protein